MRKNKMMRLASCLLVAVLLTTSMISGTFAKYVTEASGSDSARVAKWGVTVDVAVDGAFATEYDADTTANDKAGTAIAKTVVAAADDNDNLVAPGTEGDLLKTATIAGTPEVAVNVKQVADLTLEGWVVSGNDYCPIVFTVDGETYGMTGIKDADGNAVTKAYGSVADLVAAVETALNGDVNYPANTNLAEIHTVTWEWAFEGNDDVKDTALGDYAAKSGDIKIAFDYAVTVTQID